MILKAKCYNGMEKQELKALIAEYQQFVSMVQVMKRPVELEANGNYVFVGLRRAGKSYLLYQLIQEKLQSGISIEQILFVNFEDERFIGTETKDLNEILEAYREMYDREPILFLDEVQVVAGWQNFVRRLADTRHSVYVSGSNAEMLSSEIATTLGGRFLIYEVYPYSFSEYLAVNGVSLPRNWEFNSIKNKVVQLGEEYFRYGGLPEIIDIRNKRPWLSSLYQKIFFGDIVTRYSIRNDDALKLMIKKLTESVMYPVSYNRIANITSASGSKISVSTTVEYLKYLVASWLIFSVSNYASALSEKESLKKYYFIDNGILNLFLVNGNARLLENLVAITLYKRYEEQLYYYSQNVDVDFYIPSEELAVQVSYDISDMKTLDRETTALVKLRNVFPNLQAWLVTYNEERTIIQDGCKIRVVPFWKWLLLY